MPWILGAATVVLLVALTRAFVLSARAIRRDLDTRFDRIRRQLEDEATSVVRPVLEDDYRA